MLPAELIALQEKYYEDDIIFLTTKAEHASEHFSLNLTIMLQNSEGSTTQDWNIAISGYQKCHFNFEPVYEISLTNDHPLLWQFTDQHCTLHYNGQVAEPYKLIHHLRQQHASLFKSHEPFQLLKKEEQHFSFSNGLLAKGPRSLLRKYGEVLNEHGIEYTISLDDERSTHSLFDNEQLQALVLGESYIVGERFVFRRME